MARTLLFSSGLGAIIAWNWARLEQPRPGLGWLLLMIALGVAPALLPFRRWRPWVGVVTLFSAALINLEVYRPWAIGRLVHRGGSGFLDFYDVLVPFDRTAHPLMHGMVLLAICLFSLLCALSVASRRPMAATLALVAGAGWPATIRPGGDDLVRGAVLLAGALVLVAWLKPEARRAPPQVLAGTALVVAALILSGSSAVAKGQFVGWQNWDFYNRPDKPVTVEYVWRANYSGVHFPEKRTRVLTVHAPARSAYWRITTLDAFVDDLWDEQLTEVVAPQVGGRDDLSHDVLLPARARDPSSWTRVDVRVDGLRDFHLATPTGPVAFDVGSLRDRVQYETSGVAVVPRPVARNEEYKVWGYQPQPTPAALARVRAVYPSEIAYDGPYLEVERGLSALPFGAPGRASLMDVAFNSYPELARYRPLYDTAQRIAGKAKNPYAATVALEAWLRSGGGFTYDETPPQPSGPPLVGFLTKTKTGYCQHFAGAMALMLRYLGIPARVAAGFTSGAYDNERGTWRVYDRNAHTWVEVWFPGYGWLSFDPTPGRGNLSGPYTSSSISFDAQGAATVLKASALAATSLLRFELGHPGKAGPGDVRPAPSGDVGKGRGGGRTSRRGGAAVGIALLVGLALMLLFVGGKAARRRRRYLTADPRRIAGACRREVVDYLLDQGVGVPSSASLADLRGLVQRRTGVDPRTFVEAVGLARYGPESTAPTAAGAAKRELRLVRRRLRRALSLPARLRGLVSPRSLLAG